MIDFFKKLFIDISIYFQLFYVSDLAVAHDIFMNEIKIIFFAKLFYLTMVFY